MPWELRQAKAELGSTGHHKGNGDKEGMGHKSQHLCQTQEGNRAPLSFCKCPMPTSSLSSPVQVHVPSLKPFSFPHAQDSRQGCHHQLFTGWTLKTSLSPLTAAWGNVGVP